MFYYIYSLMRISNHFCLWLYHLVWVHTCALMLVSCGCIHTRTRTHTHVCMHTHTPVQMLAEARSAGCPGAGVPGDCEPPDVGAGDQSLVLHKNSVHSDALSHCPVPSCLCLCRNLGGGCWVGSKNKALFSPLSWRPLLSLSFTSPF